MSSAMRKESRRLRLRLRDGEKDEKLSRSTYVGKEGVYDDDMRPRWYVVKKY